MAARLEVPGERFEQPFHRAALHPVLKPTMARLVGRVALREILPRRPRAQDPENAVQDIAGIAPRPAPAILPDSGLGQQRREDRPLLLGQVHGHPKGEGSPPTSAPIYGLRTWPPTFMR